MLHLLYLLVFTILAVLAVGNLIRNMFILGRDAQEPNGGGSSRGSDGQSRQVPHPELLDEAGRIMNEPLLVMRSLPLDDVRSKLDALYESSPGKKKTDSPDES